MTRRVLIFGTFDGFDAGHQFVIAEAAKKGSDLVVAVARDTHVQTLKKKNPKNTQEVRAKRVSEDPHVSQVVLSDETLGTYQILDEINPDVIALGFDQDALKTDITQWMHMHNRSIPIETLSYFPE